MRRKKCTRGFLGDHIDQDFKNKGLDFGLKTNGLFTRELSRMYELDILYTGKELFVN